MDEFLLKELTDLPGGSGDEGLVREYIKNYLSKFTKVETDALGNVFARVGNGPKVLAVGHMDEIGFKVLGINNNGTIKLHNAGFVFPWGVLCQNYNVVTSKGIVKGVIGLEMNQSRPPKNEFPNVSELCLDVGCNSKQEVIDLGIEIGNSVIAESNFTRLGEDQLVAKSWDNRIGCAISIRALEELGKYDCPNITLIGGGTVQEEVGCRGARALAINIKPDVAFSLDTAPATEEDGSRLGEGPQLFVMDSTTIPNKKLLEFVKGVAKRNKIPYQLCLLRRGGTDAGEFQNITGGVPTLAIGVPVKNIHTPKSIISYKDYENTLKLFVQVCLELNKEIIEDIKTF